MVHHFYADTYLARAYSSLEGVCAHLIFTNTTSEVFVALLVTNNRHVGHIEDSLITSPLKKIKKKELVSS